ncbi:MAG: CoA-binding protein [Proteobacteria bacterium]|nr:CoA-binding protein [Pseudomonadota bacterium]
MTETETELREVLAEGRTIAVVGIKNKEAEDAYRVPRYLQEQGYRIIPVNPKYEQVLGEPCHASLREVEAPVAIVNLFRASDHIPRHVDEILAMSPLPRAVWMQLGIHDGESTTRLRAVGIDVVQDRCIMVEHKRLCA